MKFSIIVPVYNVEKYIADCLESILEQSYDNFEVIVVNDGSTDNSKKIIEKFVKKDDRVKFFDRENSGVANTRNFGIKEATGDYFIFVDSDDTINAKLLEELNDVLIKNNDLDLVKYQIQMIDGTETKYNQTEIFKNLSGEEAFAKLITNDLFVTPVTYAYRTKYFKDGKYMYVPNRVHEDFGLTPIVVINAKKVSSINYVGYNYLVRENSIMTSNSIEKIKSKNDDSLYHFDNLMNEIDKSDVRDKSKKLFKSYIANGMINRCQIMSGEVLNDYVNELKKKRIYKYLLSNSFGRVMKKIMFRLFPMIYIKKFVK